MSECVGKLTAEEMLDRLNAVTSNEPEPDPDDDARTIREWAVYFKQDRTRLSAKIDAAVKAGAMERVTRRRRKINGHVHDVDCYRFVT